MNDEIIKKIHNYLQWYADLYGNDFYVNKDNIKKTSSPEPLKNNQLSVLQQFRAEIENCTKCPLHNTRTNFVFGAGNENADILFVGEAPGKNEDLQGEPFVGQAGQLLNKMLAHIQLKRSDVYIANILKSRPPNNRDPLPEEVEACIPYLHRQIEIIKPKLLVALGRIAAQNLLNTNESLTKLRNKLWNYVDMPLIVTYHPAAILRNMDLWKPVLEDFQFILKTSRFK
jgi:DNA polymerase